MLHYCLNENWKFEYNNENKKNNKKKGEIPHNTFITSNFNCKQ
jgi:hypothetical protein